MRDDSSMIFTLDQESHAAARSQITHRERTEADTRGYGHRRTSRPPAVSDETLVVDERMSQTPAQAVENKLLSRLQGASLPVSHLQIRGLVRGRRDG